MEIAAFYQCYKNSRAFAHSLDAFRKYYPDCILHIVNDGGDETLETIAREYYATSYTYSHNIGKLCWQNEPKEVAVNGILVWLSRLNECIQSLPESCKYLLNLEDDVLVMNPVTVSTLEYDINGCNYNAVFTAPLVNEYITAVNPSMADKKIFYGGCGGCIFRVDFFKRVLSDMGKVREEVIRFCDLGALQKGQMAADCVISYLTYINGGTIGQYPGFCETHHHSYRHRKAVNNIEVLHRYTELYD